MIKLEGFLLANANVWLLKSSNRVHISRDEGGSVLGVDLKTLGHTLIVRLEGELDLHTAAPFKKSVSEALESNPRIQNLVLLMADVTFVDSSCVGAILGRYREATARGGRVAAVGLQIPVEKVFRMSGMVGIIDTYDSEGQALASL